MCFCFVQTSGWCNNIFLSEFTYVIYSFHVIIQRSDCNVLSVFIAFFIFEKKKSSVKCEANIYQNNLGPVTLMVQCNFRKIKVDIEMDEGLLL